MLGVETRGSQRARVGSCLKFDGGMSCWIAGTLGQPRKLRKIRLQLANQLRRADEDACSPMTIEAGEATARWPRMTHQKCSPRALAREAKWRQLSSALCCVF